MDWCSSFLCEQGIFAAARQHIARWGWRGARHMNVKQKILIADDSEINRALLMEILGDG